MFPNKIYQIKLFVQPEFAANISTPNKALFDASNLTSSRIVTFPDISITLVGEASTQSISNKNYINAVFADAADPTKKINFDLSGTIANTNFPFGFPITLNTTGTSILVTETASQTLRNKNYDKPQFVDIADFQRRVFVFIR